VTGGGVPRPAPANKTALAARVRNAARSADLPEGRVQRQLGVLVVAELLGRVRNENGQQLFLVKGGSSIELRLGVASSRTTKDLDAVFRGTFSRMYNTARDALAGPTGNQRCPMPATELPNRPEAPRMHRRRSRWTGQ